MGEKRATKRGKSQMLLSRCAFHFAAGRRNNPRRWRWASACIVVSAVVFSQRAHSTHLCREQFKRFRPSDAGAHFAIKTKERALAERDALPRFTFSLTFSEAHFAASWIGVNKSIPISEFEVVDKQIISSSPFPIYPRRVLRPANAWDRNCA